MIGGVFSIFWRVRRWIGGKEEEGFAAGWDLVEEVAWTSPKFGMFCC